MQFKQYVKLYEDDSPKLSSYNNINGKIVGTKLNKPEPQPTKKSDRPQKTDGQRQNTR